MAEINERELEKNWPADSARASVAGPEPVDLFRAAFVALAMEKPGEADKFVKKGLAIIPKTNVFYHQMILLRAQVFAFEGNFAAAKNDMDSVLSVEPDNYIALLNRTYMAANLHDHQTAIAYAKQMLKYYPADSFALNNLAYSNTEIRQYQEGLKYGMQGLAVAKGSRLRSALLNNTGLAMGMTGDVEKGLQMIKESLVLRPDNPYAWCNKGILLLKQGKKDEACAAFLITIENGGEKMVEPYFAENCRK